MQHFRVVYHGISRDSISLHTHKPLGGVHTKIKYKLQVGYSTVFHKKVLHNYFIPCYRKNSGQHHAARNGKVECNIVEYSTAFLFSADRLNFL